MGAVLLLAFEGHPGPVQFGKTIAVIGLDAVGFFDTLSGSGRIWFSPDVGQTQGQTPGDRRLRKRTY